MTVIRDNTTSVSRLVSCTCVCAPVCACACVCVSLKCPVLPVEFSVSLSPLWLFGCMSKTTERLLIQAYICIIIRSEPCQLSAWALLQLLMKLQHTLMTHDALRAWELCGLKAVMSKAILIGHDNRKWHQLKAQRAIVCNPWKSHDHCMCGLTDEDGWAWEYSKTQRHNHSNNKILQRRDS